MRQMRALYKWAHMGGFLVKAFKHLVKSMGKSSRGMY